MPADAAPSSPPPLPRLPLAEAAHRSDLIEESGPSVAPRWITRNGAPLRHQAGNPFLSWVTMPHVELRLWHLRNVVLDADSFVLLQAGHILDGTTYMTPPDALAALHVDPSRLTRLDGDAPHLVCGDSWSTNHFHFLCHTLPTIAAAHHSGLPGRPTLLHQPFLPPHLRALEQLGLHTLPRRALEPGRQYAIPHAVFCDYAVGKADFAASPFLADLHARLRDTVAGRSTLGRRLYVSRLQTRHRIARGEAAFADALRRRGFDILDPAALTLDEQIAAFREAKLVVGPHGAGMANITFCAEAAEIYQLLPRIFDEPSVMVLALRRGLAYWADTFEPDSEDDAPVFLRAWHLDEAQALSRIEELLPAPFLRRLAQTARNRLRRPA